MLDPQMGRRRQRRLLDVMERQRLDAVVVGQRRHVYYLSAHWTDWRHSSAFVLFSDGRSLLVPANKVNDTAAADECVPFEANWAGTLRQEQPRAVASTLLAQLDNPNRNRRKPARVGVDASAVTSQVAMQFAGACEPVDAHLWQIRRAKDPDELELMRVSIRCCAAMYAKAREMIAPGVAELDVFNALHAEAVRTAGEPLSGMLGNDYACGVPGGPARGGRVAKEGEVYILDLGPAYRGYFSDNCRAFAVNRKPTDEQMRAWHAVAGAFPIIERMAGPGTKCRDIYKAVYEHMKQAYGTGLSHHLGHGVGLEPHEYPHLNLKWDDTLIEGEVFTAEPGVYGPAIAGGIRLEQNYRVTATGVESLLDVPLDLR